MSVFFFCFMCKRVTTCYSFPLLLVFRVLSVSSLVFSHLHRRSGDFHPVVWFSDQQVALLSLVFSHFPLFFFLSSAHFNSCRANHLRPGSRPVSLNRSSTTPQLVHHSALSPGDIPPYLLDGRWCVFPSVAVPPIRPAGNTSALRSLTVGHGGFRPPRRQCKVLCYR